MEPLHRDIQRSITDGGARLLARGVPMSHMYYSSRDGRLHCWGTRGGGKVTDTALSVDREVPWTPDDVVDATVGLVMGKREIFEKTQNPNRYSKVELIEDGDSGYLMHWSDSFPEVVNYLPSFGRGHCIFTLNGRVFLRRHALGGWEVVYQIRTPDGLDKYDHRAMPFTEDEVPLDADPVCLRVIGDTVFVLHVKHHGGRYRFGLVFREMGSTESQVKHWEDAVYPTVFDHGQHVLVVATPFRSVYTAGKSYPRNLPLLAKKYEEVASFQADILHSMVAVGKKGFYLVAAYPSGVVGLVDLVIHPNPLQSHVYRDAVLSGDLKIVTTMKNCEFLSCTSAPEDRQACFLATMPNAPGDRTTCLQVGEDLDCRKTVFVDLGLKKNRVIQTAMDDDEFSGDSWIYLPLEDNGYDILDLSEHDMHGIQTHWPVTAMTSYGIRAYCAMRFGGGDDNTELQVIGGDHEWRFFVPIQGEIMQIILDDEEQEMLVVYRQDQAPHTIMLAAVEMDFRHMPYAPYVEDFDLDIPGEYHDLNHRDIGPLISEGGVPVTQVYYTGGRRYNIAPHEWGNPGGRNIFEKMPIVGACKWGERHCLLAIQDGASVDICLSLDPSLLDDASRYWAVFKEASGRFHDDDLPRLGPRPGDDASDTARFVKILRGLPYDVVLNMAQVMSAYTQKGAGFRAGPGYRRPRLNETGKNADRYLAQEEYAHRERHADMVKAFEQGRL